MPLAPHHQRRLRREHGELQGELRGMQGVRSPPPGLLGSKEGPLHLSVSDGPKDSPELSRKL